MRYDRDQFVKQLAVFLVGNQAEMSVLLRMGKPEAYRWRALRMATPLTGYPTVEAAERELRQWLFEATR